MISRLHNSLRLVVLILLCILAAGFSLCAGCADLTLYELFDPANANLLHLRILRTAAAFTVGGSLALAGLIFQAVLRNPLADPFTLGLSGGAGVGAALAFLTGLAALSPFSVPVCSFAGALLLLCIVLIVSRGTENLLLSGVIAGTVASGILLFLLSEADGEKLNGITWWMLGDLSTPDERFLFPLIILAVLCLAFLVRRSRDLDALSLGNERAFHLGIDPRRFTLCLILPASLLTAGTVALAGIIGFCGLIIPHAVRRIFGSLHRCSVLPAFFCGGLFLMVCDTVSRLVFSSREIPVGVLTALIGGPVFLWILNRRKIHGA